MATDPAIRDNVAQIRQAVYGKDVREAIARGLEICYGYTSGDSANTAANRANAAAERVENIIQESEDALDAIESAVENVDSIIKVSELQPTEPENKIWIQPQDDTEYKVATFAAYEELWSRMNTISNTYEQGHGGIVSITRDDTYSDPQDEYKRRFVVTYSDGTTSEFFVNDGATGQTGPVDAISGTTLYYHKGVLNNGTLVTTPPVSGWSTSIPTMNAGDYLWTQTVVSYGSGAKAYIYGITRWGNNGANGRDGVDGTGAVNSVKLGASGTALVGDIVLPLDSTPTVSSSNLISSGAVYEALQNAGSLDSPAFVGTPTAPTASDPETSTTQIATTEFVQNALEKKLVLARQVTLTLNGKQIVYLDDSITEDTVILLIGDLDYSKLLAPVSWETTDGQLKLSTAETPKSSMTIKAILLDTVPDNL